MTFGFTEKSNTWFFYIEGLSFALEDLNHSCRRNYQTVYYFALILPSFVFLLSVFQIAFLAAISYFLLSEHYVFQRGIIVQPIILADAESSRNTY